METTAQRPASITDATAAIRGGVERIASLSITGEVVSIRPGNDDSLWLCLADAESATDVFVPAVRVRGSRVQLKLGQVLSLKVTAKLKRSGTEVYWLTQWLEHLHDQGTIASTRKKHLEELVAEEVIGRENAGAFSYANADDDRVWPAMKRILVLTSEGSDGLADFHANTAKLTRFARIRTETVPVQGPDMTPALVSRLSEIESIDADIVCLLRGGGSWGDLRHFDDPELARAIARCKSPVLTAVGHARDVRLADRAAFAAFETPSNAGKFLQAENGRQWQRANPLRGKSRHRAAQLQAEAVARRAELADRGQEVAQLRHELRSARDDAAQTRRTMDDVCRFTNQVLLSAALDRVKFRSRALGLCGSVVVAVLVATGVRWGGWEVLGPAAAVAALVAFYVLRGPKRALCPARKVRKLHRVSDTAQWASRVQATRTPRELRALREQVRPSSPKGRRR